MVKDYTSTLTCSVCKAEARAIAGTNHRRCTGQAPQQEQPAQTIAIRAKYHNMPSASRGMWQ